VSVDLLERPAPSEAGTGTGNGGVPARRAQPGWSGPTKTNAAVPSGTRTVAAMAAVRPAPGWASDSRHHAAPATPATHSASRSSSQDSSLSVPVPSPCQSAMGQHPYERKCTARQVR